MKDIIYHKCWKRRLDPNKREVNIVIRVHLHLHVSPCFPVDLSGVPPSRSFLERLDYESELGAVDPFEEDFSAIATHEIVEVIADGDRVGR